MIPAYLFIFLFGLAIGSFLNVLICRLETGETIIGGRSHCRDCGHILAWYDLIPVLSFLILGGKCRYCRRQISIQYPLVELATGILFALVVSRYLIYDLRFTIYDLFITSSLIVIFVYDLKHYVIPDKIIYPAIGVSFVYLLFRALNFGYWNLFGIWDLGFGILNPFLNGLFASVLASGFFFAIVVITKGAGMGGGDVKLAFLMGLILGWPKVLAALFLAFTAGAIYGIILIVMRKKTLKSQIPFGPFLAAGTVIAILWGEEIVKWYGGYLL